MPASRKLYEDVAESFSVIRSIYGDDPVVRLLEEYLITDFTRDNPRFNAAKFKEACTHDYQTGLRP